jgi:hypothetical protein
MVIIPFRDATATQTIIHIMVDLIRQEVMTSRSFKSPILAEKIIFLLEEAMNKSKFIKQTKKIYK